LTMIDVLHHVKLEGQKEFLAKINSVGAGRVIFKDIDPAARVKSIFNTVHDILLSHQRPNYCSKEEVAGWLEEFGFKVSCVKRCDMLWYSHYLIVADKV
ncbi:MAG: hypothetical protein H8D47_02405, partial [Planctomycetes bacterium]|nr:hypothetical protein [Planctomycetota bacterium]